MAQHIHKCPECNTYTLQKRCMCGTNTILPKPPKFTLDDKYSSYRRKARKEKLTQKGLL